MEDPLLSNDSFNKLIFDLVFLSGAKGFHGFRENPIP